MYIPKILARLMLKFQSRSKKVETLEKAAPEQRRENMHAHLRHR